MLNQWDMHGCVPAHRAAPNVPSEEARRATMATGSESSPARGTEVHATGRDLKVLDHC